MSEQVRRRIIDVCSYNLACGIRQRILTTQNTNAAVLIALLEQPQYFCWVALSILHCH